MPYSMFTCFDAICFEKHVNDTFCIWLLLHLILGITLQLAQAYFFHDHCNILSTSKVCLLAVKRCKRIQEDPKMTLLKVQTTYYLLESL